MSARFFVILLMAIAPSISRAEQEPVLRILPNGFTLIVREDRSAPVASVQMWCGTGSIHEGKWQGAGLSHILEHMLFKGTERRPAGHIAREVQEVGGYINAYTTFERTVYWIDVPKEGASTAIDVLCDAMRHSTLPESEYAKEQEVIRREFAMGNDNPEDTLHKLLFSTAYQSHPYRDPVIGHLDIYNRLTREDVMAYYRERYVPNNLVLVVVGDVDAGAVEKQVEGLVRDWPRQALAPLPTPVEPTQLGARSRFETFPSELSRLFVAWHTPGITHPDMPALDVLAMILGQGRSSRLHRILREEKRLAHSVSAFSHTPADTGLFGVFALCDPDKREELSRQIQEQVREVRDKEVDPAEVEKARKQTLARHYGKLTTMSGQAEDLGESWTLARNLDFGRDYLEAVGRVTTADLRRVASTYLRDQNRTMAALDPPGAAASEAKPDEIVPGPAMRKFELSNGLRLLVREDPRLPLVECRAVFRAGVLEETPGESGAGRLVSRTMIKGTAKRDADGIAAALENVGGGIGSGSGYNSMSVGVQVMKDDLALGLEMLGEVVLQPSFPAEEVEREKQLQIAEIKAQEDRVTTVAFDRTRAALFPNHGYGRRVNGTRESVAALGRDALVRFHRNTVSGKRGVIAVFGAVDAEEVRGRIEKLFGGLASGEPAEDPPVPSALVTGDPIVEPMPKEQAVLVVGFRGPDIASPDRVPLELVGAACNDLASRLFDRIREQLGLAYFTGAAMAPGINAGSFSFYVGTDPRKVDQVRQVLLDEISRIAGEGITEEELARAKKKTIGSEEIENQSNSQLAAACALDELLGLGYDHYQHRRTLVEAVTLQQAKAVSARYFRDRPSVSVTVAPARGEPQTEKP